MGAQPLPSGGNIISDPIGEDWGNYLKYPALNCKMCVNT